MILRTKPIALVVGMTSLLAVAALGKGQGPGQGATSKVAIAPKGTSANTVTVGGYLYIIDRCDLASLREGVLSSLERHVGDEVNPKDHIAFLNSDVARLTTEKADLARKNQGEVEKAEAQKKVATAVYTRSLRLEKKNPGTISQDQLDKEEADVMLSRALVNVAKEQLKLNEAEYNIAAQIEKEHDITTPIGGIITEVLRRPGERVGTNEPVVKIVNLDRLRWSGNVPIEAAGRLRPGDQVEVRVTIEDADLEIEKMVLPAKITFISPDAQPANRTEIEVHATLTNPRTDNGKGPHLLRAGLRAQMTIHSGPKTNNTVGSR